MEIAAAAIRKTNRAKMRHQMIASERLIASVEGYIMPEGRNKSMSKWKMFAIAAAIALLFVGGVVWSQPGGRNRLPFFLFFAWTKRLLLEETEVYKVPGPGFWQIIVENNAGYGAGGPKGTFISLTVGMTDKKVSSLKSAKANLQKVTL